jgi:hypothetical protein
MTILMTWMNKLKVSYGDFELTVSQIIRLVGWATVFWTFWTVQQKVKGTDAVAAAASAQTMLVERQLKVLEGIAVQLPKTKALSDPSKPQVERQLERVETVDDLAKLLERLRAREEGGT